MNAKEIFKVLSIAAFISTSAIGYAAADNSGHSNQITCYAAVQTECYGNGEDNCTPEDYNDALDYCDDAYAEIDQGGRGPGSYTLDLGDSNNSRQRQ